MAIILSEPYIAVGSIQSTGGDAIKRATVKIIPTGMEGFAVGDVVFFHKDSGNIILYNGTEYMIVKKSDLFGRMG